MINEVKSIEITDRRQWIGFDLDGTIAEFHQDKWNNNINHIGKPIQIMINIIKQLIKQDIRVKIFTARASRSCSKPAVEKWIRKHIGHTLEITNVKDFYCVAIFDDLAIGVEFNTGKFDKPFRIWKNNKFIV